MTNDEISEMMNREQRANRAAMDAAQQLGTVRTPITPQVKEAPQPDKPPELVRVEHPHQATVMGFAPREHSDAEVKRDWRARVAKITQEEHQHIAAIAVRWRDLLLDHQRRTPKTLIDIPPVERLRTDVAVVHTITPLDLVALRGANILDFGTEMMTISQHIVRPVNQWPKLCDSLLKFRRRSFAERVLFPWR